jgi:hypothetical protein
VRLETLTIAKRFCGPSRSGNGGYTCGRIARHVPGTASVRLFVPPPLDRELHLEAHDNTVQLLDDGRLVGEARPATLDLDAPPPPDLATASAASQRYLGFTEHAFPECFVCGPGRRHGDGLCIFAGPCPSPVPGLVASPWTPDASIADADGSIASEFIWAALDCPGAFSLMPTAPGKAIVLGKFTVRIDAPLHVDEACVVVGWPLHQQGRKQRAGSALYGGKGQLIGIAGATWIEVDAARFQAA